MSDIKVGEYYQDIASPNRIQIVVGVNSDTVYYKIVSDEFIIRDTYSDFPLDGFKRVTRPIPEYKIRMEIKEWLDE